MKSGFISCTFHSFVSYFHILAAADSAPELAIVVCNTDKLSPKEHITSPKQDLNGISKGKGYAHQYSKTLLAALSITATMAGTEAKAQTSATIDPDYYSMENPFVIPNLPDRSSINIKIKTGKATPITMDDLASGQSIEIQNPHGAMPESDIITLNEPGVRSWRYTNKEGEVKIINIDVNYQADIFDRTDNSLTENMRPEIIRVDVGQQATLSAGPNMGYYRWRNIDDSLISGGYTDSTKTVSGSQSIISETRDKSGILPNGLTRDTIAILQKPTFNKITRKYDFPSTEKNITYRLYKYDLSGSKSIADSTRTMVESFVGDGNPYTSATPLSDKSIYRISAQRTPATDEDTHLPSLITNFGTGMEDISQVSLPFNIQRHRVILLHETSYELYSISGSRLMAGKATKFYAPSQAGVYLLVIDNNAYKINISP